MSGNVAEWCNDNFNGAVPPHDKKFYPAGYWGNDATWQKVDQYYMENNMPTRSVGFRVMRKE